MAPSLNPAQAQAVDHQNGPLLVLAGAGSGKTRVITHRIAKLVERGIPQRAIVALTFTNKAAGEMRERVAALVGGPRASGRRSRAPKEEGVTVSTFHSFGLGVLTREKAALGGAFTIYDQGDQLGVVKEVLRTIHADKSYDATAILTRISNAKNGFVAPEDLPDSGVDEYDEITKIVYPRYQAALRQFRAFDFDDLVCEVARVWNRRDDVLKRWQERYHYVLVDEYQDTNRAQLEVLRLLAATHRNVCVVGDDDQSIYSWRGADVRNILDFEEHFPGATVIKLEQNYRSRAPVLEVANSVISKRTDSKYRKTLFTDRAGGDKVVSLTAPSPEAEAMHVARELREMIKGEGRRPRDLAVLYRSNGQAKLVEDALREQGVPYRLVGGTQFFERKEVKDLLSYMKIVVNPHDDISLRRIINYPARGIGDTSVERLATHAVARGWSLWQAVERVDALDDIPATAREGCKALEAAVVAATKSFAVDKQPASTVARGLAESAGLKQEIVTSSPSNDIAARRWGNVEGLFGTFTRHETNHGEKAAAGLASLLHALTLDLSQDEEEEIDAVTLSTLHGSKGLEFDVVFLIGCEEGYLPHSRTLDQKATDAAPQDIEEERRLFYVGVTRAREKLFLSRTRARMLRGKPTPRVTSRFLLGVPAEMLEEREVKDVSAMSHVETAQAADALLAALASLGS